MLLTLFAFAFALGLLVTFHEFGHYSVARLCGVRILRFSVGFGPVLCRRHDRHGTEWAVSAIPLGGYVKMLDEAPAASDASTRRASFNAQPLWRRFAIVLAGPLANLVLAALIYAFLGMWGTMEPAATLAAPPANTPAAIAGIQAGDTVEAVDGHKVASWSQARWRLMEPLSQGGTLALAVSQPHMGAREITLQIPSMPLSPDGPDPLKTLGLALVAPRPVIGSLTPDGAAQASGLRPGDQVIAVGGKTDPSVQSFVQDIQAHAGQALAMEVLRDGTRLALAVTPRPESLPDGKTVGRIGALVQGSIPMVEVRLGPWDSVAAGFGRTVETSLFSLKMMGRMLTGSVSWRNVSGPVTIAEYAGQTARIGLESYLGFLALISISIGILNLLPIPMLDGGHLLFYVLEALRGGRPVPARIREFSLRVGLAIVMALMFLALFNDFVRLFS